MSKKKKKILQPLLRKLLNPVELSKVIRLQRNRKKVDRAYDDAQLKLYAQILPGDFLHYGYFDNPDIDPADMTLNMIYQAQLRYGQILADQVKDTQSPVLDIGCGMGGLLPLLKEKGFPEIQALTPDKNQVQHISQKYPFAQLHHCKFEDLPAEGLEGHFGTLITSESLQYLKPDQAFPLMDKLLKPGGQWIACDYFRVGETAHERSGHQRKDFEEDLEKYGFKIVYERDITPNILPTISYVHMWATRIGMPLKEFALGKLRVKSPGFHYALEESLGIVEEKLNKNIETVNPVTFARQKQYVLLVMEKK